MKNKRIRYIVMALVLIAVGIAVYFIVDALTDRSQASENNGTKTASLRFNVLDEPVKSADITFEDMDGNVYALSDFEGRNVIINFWAVFCGPCVSELPEFDEAVDTFEKSDTVVLAINVVEPKDEIEDFLADMKLKNLGFYMDINGNSAYTYSVSTIPRTLVIDRDGYIIAAASGAVTYDDLMSLTDLLN